MVYIGLLAGMVNGLSFLAYSKVVANPEWDISIYAPLTIAMMLMVPAVGGIVFFGESFSAIKGCGLIMILVGAYMIC